MIIDFLKTLRQSSIIQTVRKKKDTTEYTVFSCDLEMLTNFYELHKVKIEQITYSNHRK